MINDLRTVIIQIMEEDTDFTLLNNKNIIESYEKSGDLEKTLVNYIFMNLTGYELGTIIEEL